MSEGKAKEMCEVVEKNLKEHKWRFDVHELKAGNWAIDTSVSSDCGILKGYDIRFLFHKWEMTAIYYTPLRAPEKQRNEVAAYLTRINWTTRFGKHMLDFNDGEIRTEVIFLPDAVLKAVNDVMDICLSLILNTLDQYTPGLMAVIGGMKTAAQAFEDAQKKPEEKPTSEPPPEPVPPEFFDDIVSDPEPEPPKEEKKGKAKGKKRGKKAAEDHYSLEGLNLTTPVPLTDIISAVKKFRSGEARPDVDRPRLNILLSGAPGSGKTAFVRYLADQVGAPLKTMKVSDVLSRFSGETEKRISEAFRAAKEEDAILFLDEVDSFLQDRAGASHSWEVAQVNELLQQMEDFEGVMVGATNFVDNLDKAVLRRFTYKIKLDTLTNEGKAIFFNRYFKTKMTDEEKTRLEAIENLTPGDFRTVSESLFYLADKQTNAARLEALEAESQAKGKARARIGFAV